MVPHGYLNKNRIETFCSQKVVKLDGDKKDWESISGNLKVILERVKSNLQAKDKINATEQLKKATYEKANLLEINSKLMNLSQDQRKDLLQILLKHKAELWGKWMEER